MCFRYEPTRTKEYSHGTQYEWNFGTLKFYVFSEHGEDFFRTGFMGTSTRHTEEEINELLDTLMLMKTSDTVQESPWPAPDPNTRRFPPPLRRNE